MNPAAALCARANADVYMVNDSVSVACADVTRLRPRGDAAFFDPSRRREGRLESLLPEGSRVRPVRSGPSDARP